MYKICVYKLIKKTILSTCIQLYICVRYNFLVEVAIATFTITIACVSLSFRVYNFMTIKLNLLN